MTDQSKIERDLSPAVPALTEQRSLAPHDRLRGPDFDPRDWLSLQRIEQRNRANSALFELLHRDREPGRIAELTARGIDPDRPAPAPVAPAEALPWWPVSRLPATPLAPPPGDDFLSDSLLRLETRAFDVTGLSPADLARAVELVHERQGSGRGFRPLFLTDSGDLSAFIARGYAAEYFAAWDRSDPAAVTARRASILRKWGVDTVEDLREVRAPVHLPPPAPAPRPATKPAEAKPAAAKPAAAPKPKKKPKALVVCWDLGHNPAGRGMVIYDLLERDWDVEMIGPLWRRFGGKVWGPIADGHRKVRGFPCATLEEFWPAALAYASAVECDLVVACKPRLPSILLASLIKKATGCPLVLDIDDFELSFFPDETSASLDELAAAGTEALAEPYSELATRACDAITGAADASIVSNIALRDRFGGTMVRHARDEEAFDPARFDRAAERRTMGMAPEDFALVFVGTARAHKGVFDIARTLAALDDKRFVLHLVGDITDRRIRNQLDAHEGARIVYHPNCPFEMLPNKLAAADAVVLLQDAGHPISQYQIPAKVSDANALGLKILVTDVPPLRDLALQGLVSVIEPSGLGAALEELIAQRDADGGAAAARPEIREAFEAELGLRVNRERLELAISRAARKPKTLAPELERLIEITGAAYTALRAAARPAAGTPVRFTRARARARLDLAMFWKQNDSGIYGRRSDRLMKALLDSGRFGRVLQFEAPVEMTQMAASAEAPVGSPAALILRNTIDNQTGLRDTETHRMRSYLWSRRKRELSLPPVRESLLDYPVYVEDEMRRWGLKPENTVAWVCPVVFDFPAVAKHIPFRAVIGDLIDDQRHFEMSPVYRERIIASYDETVPLFDHAFTNCAAQVEAFRDLNSAITVVPNGTDLNADLGGEIPVGLANAKGPIAGYVGNLRDRFDWLLMRDLAERMPEITFVIVGGGARERDIVHLEGLPNVIFTGVVTSDRVPACIAKFDVALVPHTLDRLTDRMNPLKIYNYFAGRKPIVSTRVGNIDEALKPYIRFGGDAGEFEAGIRAALETPLVTDAAYEDALNGISWDSRAAAILAKLDELLETR